MRFNSVNPVFKVDLPRFDSASLMRNTSHQGLPIAHGGEGAVKKSNGVLRRVKQVRFAFVEEHSRRVPVERLCRMLKVTSRGFRAWRDRPISQRHRYDMVLLAHIRKQHHLSLGSYGRPRMTQELKEIGPMVGHRRVGRLMRNNGIRIVRTCK